MNVGTSPCLLIVDDEPAVLLSHAVILERMGYEVAQASTAEQASFLLSTRSFDLLICDLSLGTASGLDVITGALGHNPHLPVILMTGYADTLLPKALETANITVLSKPTSIPEFLQTIERLLYPGSAQTAD